MSIKNAQQLIDIIGKFKDLKRSGWVRKQVSVPESDAEHSFSVALLAMLLAPDNLDKEKCLELALVHDLAEIYIGDYTPNDHITPETKQQKELMGMKQIADELGEGGLMGLFEEYAAKSSKEAIFINVLDKIDNVITAAYYDKNKRAPLKLTAEFSDYAQSKIAEMPDTEELKLANQLLQEIINQANQ